MDSTVEWRIVMEQGVMVDFCAICMTVGVAAGWLVVVIVAVELVKIVVGYYSIGIGYLVM